MNPSFGGLDLEIVLICHKKTYHIGCDDWSCHSMCEEGFTFKGFVVERSRWLGVERPCAKLCTMSPFICRLQSGSIIPTSL